MFIAKNFIVVSEIDNFDKGCDLDSSVTYWPGITLENESLDSLLEELATTFGIEKGELVLGACDEPSRVDFDWHSVKAGDTSKPRESTLNEWKEGKRELYLNAGSCIVEEIKPVDFKSLGYPVNE